MQSALVNRAKARWFGSAIALSITMVAVSPATAQRYDPRSPVCLQRWEWGGSSIIDCSYDSWDACRSATIGLPAMCLINPYWAQTTTTGATRRPHRGTRDQTLR
ncbi:DUF3551 domain-containing protein [uncultured Bradyrhizobium sp.]|uniref:DUF3551 domain-containing protein n=1 Tax=uncultured Bradyrhizobium sp. TaxID=199684 RepID=UPI00343B4284